MKYSKFIWPFSFYFLIFAGGAAFGPYRVLYYQSLSFTGPQIGLLVGIAPLLTMVSLPLITGIADRTNKHKLIMSFSLLVAISGLILLPFLKNFIIVLAIAVLIAVFFSPVQALSNSATMIMLGDRKELTGVFAWAVRLDSVSRR